VSELWLGNRPVRREAIIGALLIPVVFFLVVVLLNVLMAVAPWLHNVPTNPLEQMAGTAGGAALLAIVAILAGGVREELQRAFLLRRFEQHLGGAAAGVVVLSVAFLVATLFTAWTPASLLPGSLAERFAQAVAFQATATAEFPTPTPRPRPLIGRLHRAVERDHAAIGIDVDARQARRLIARQLGLDRRGGVAVVDILTHGSAGNRLAAAEHENQNKHRCKFFDCLRHGSPLPWALTYSQIKDEARKRGGSNLPFYASPQTSFATLTTNSSLAI